MEEHVMTMQDLIDKLTALGEEIKEHLFVAMLLSSLPESYSTLITALESRSEEELTLNLVTGKLIDEYRRRKGVPNTEDLSIALKVSQNKETDKIKEKTCYFCKNPRHFKQECTRYRKWKANKLHAEKANRIEEGENQEFVKTSTSLLVYLMTETTDGSLTLVPQVT